MAESGGEIRVSGVELFAYTSDGSKKARLALVVSDGRRLPTESLNEVGIADQEYVRQRNAGLKLARRNNIGFTEVDEDLTAEVLKARLANTNSA